ncbi:MAG: IS3 family transposase [Balneolales bacterium]
MIWFWQFREKQRYSLNELYRAIEISKQGVHSLLDNFQRKMEMEATLVNLIHEIRKDHPTMALRSMYHKIKPEGIGRDRFEAICVLYGFKTYHPRNYKRTTYSDGVKRFPNLLSNLKITAVNQVWVSDITYFEVEDQFYYITFVMDAYSRFIKGYHVSQSLRTVATTIPALRMAIKKYKPPKDLIFHSDGGGQYYSKRFLKLTAAHSIKNSMAKEAYQNPQAERINGTIKNGYLRHWNINNYKTLVKLVDRAVALYNYEKPHKSLKYLMPKNMEENQYICNGQPVEGDESRTAILATIGASSPSVAGQPVSGSDVHPAI